MLSPVWHIALALVLDQLLGDPRWLPHPVRLIGKLQVVLEKRTRQLIPPARIAGLLTVLLTLALTGGLTWGLLHGAQLLHPLISDVVAVILLYTSFAARDLARHATAVSQALQHNDIALARQRVAMIVGRDTAGLDEAGVTRAGVESVAESLVDGVTAPIFYALIAGPMGAMLYKAINTGDSMFGYKNERYQEFGWAAARLDDVANFVPARLTALLIPFAALCLGLKARGSLRILRRDCRAHASPNSGFPEAAVAGALDVQLGGSSSYFGKIISKPTIGDANQKIQGSHLGSAVNLMLLTSALFFGLGALITALL
ncbi:MAG: adenosylcobinamide-phosphate synthase CbiB [Proteobacteria bacterium]|nr:adenosylcobinamide-phosphate synthase CbiB [Pseudomonadota bacterium]MBU1641394.1 adenosylcobinamide-phosphate synthase CbiB [Pseudomonadota bacterium]